MQELCTHVEGLWTSPAEIAVIAFRTLVVYVFILAAFRLSGEREVGQLAPFDFALVLLIANSVQNAMVGPGSLPRRGPRRRGRPAPGEPRPGPARDAQPQGGAALRGEARILVNRGHVHQDALRAEEISHEELLQALRENGCATLAECRLAVLEVDGRISVIPSKA